MSDNNENENKPPVPPSIPGIPQNMEEAAQPIPQVPPVPPVPDPTQKVEEVPVNDQESVTSDTSAAESGESSTGLEPNIAAALASFFSILGGIIFLVLEKKNQFIRFYALQAIYLWVVAFGVMIVFSVLSAILSSIPVLGTIIWFLLLIPQMLLGFVFLGLWLVMTFRAFNGEKWELPYLGEYVKKHLARLNGEVS